MLIMDNEWLRVEALELGMWATNCYVVVSRRTGSSVLIDAPAEAERILQALQGAKPSHILVTHRHGDHTGALAELRSRLPAPVAAHPADARSLPCPVDRLLTDGDVIAAGDLEFHALHTPGHTAGSLCFRLGDILFSGDTLFPGGPGRTDSPDAFRQILVSITEKLLVLPEETPVYPGHGAATVLGKEKDEFAAFSRRAHAPDLCGDVLWLTS